MVVVFGHLAKLTRLKYLRDNQRDNYLQKFFVKKNSRSMLWSDYSESISRLYLKSDYLKYSLDSNKLDPDKLDPPRFL